MNNFDRVTCYICGKIGADSVDHIPPKCIYPQKYRNSNLLTVPAHITCNKLYEKDDEYFCDTIVLASSGFNKKAEELFNDKIKRSLSRKSAQGYLKMHQKQLGEMEIRTPSGLFVKSQPIKIMDKTRMDTVITRIGKALIYSNTKNIFPVNNPITVNFMQPDSIQIRNDLLNQSKIPMVTVVKDIFEYFWIRNPDAPDDGQFLLFFYGCLTFHIGYGKWAKAYEPIPENRTFKKFEGIKFTDETLWFPPGTNFYK